MNVILVSGVLEKLEAKQTSTGLLTKMQVATHERYFKPDPEGSDESDDGNGASVRGEWKVSRTPFDVCCWGRLAQDWKRAEVGSYVFVQGSMKLRCYKVKEQKRWSWELTAQRIEVVTLATEGPAEAMPDKLKDPDASAE